MKTNFRMLAVATAFAMTPALYAEESQDTAADSIGGGESEAADVAAVTNSADKADQKFFHLLPLCRRLEGSAEVLMPTVGKWEPIEEGKFYPLGCSYRTLGDSSRLSIQFGGECEIKIEGVASFATLGQGLGEKSRTISLQSGTIALSLPRNLPAGMFKVSAPGFTVVEAAGESLYTYRGTGDGDEAVVRCVTGVLALNGRHFKVTSMRAADEIRIRTSQDMLFTGLYGTSGDYHVLLDQGDAEITDVNTEGNQEKKVMAQTLDWQLSPKTAIRIHRSRPTVGERMSVAVMTFDANGALVNRCSFTEGRYEVNTGEEGELALKAKEESAKKAVEDADAQTTTEPAEESGSEEASNKEKTTTEESSTEE